MVFHHPSQPAWVIYKQQMDQFHYGDALWQPSPVDGRTRVELGDVGFIRRGRFYLLFSARQRGEDVPETFEPLDISPTTCDISRSSGYLGTATIRRSGADVGASVSTTPSMGPGVSFSFELTKKQGAALVTKYCTFQKDIVREAAVGNVDPVLVTGVDMTRDHAMMAYSNDGTQISSKFTVSVPPIASASASAWGEWENEGTVHTRCWPQFRPPPPDTPELEPFDDIPREIPEQYNQCVFIRYYTMRRRAFMFPKVIRAAAGPHDPGPGNNPDDILPEPMVQSNSDASNEFDDGENSTIDRSGLVTDDDSELEIFHNVASEEGGMTPLDVIAEYVFKNSKAQAALVHHHDIAQLREGSPEAEISEILSERQPPVEVDGGGVGKLVHRTQEKTAATLPSFSDYTEERKINLHPLRAALDHLPEAPPEDTKDVGDAVYGRFLKNISAFAPELSSVPIPQRPYRQGTAIPGGGAPQRISFTMVNANAFPADLAFSGECTGLVDEDRMVFAEQTHVINIRIEWPGYDGWGAQIRTVDYREIPRSITRAKLVREIAKQLQKFIEKKQFVDVHPGSEMYKVGPGGIGLHHIRIASLEQVSRGTWQPRLFSVL